MRIGSELDPALYEVVIVDARIDPDAERTVLSHIGEAVCLGVTVLTGAPISDAPADLALRPSGRVPTCPSCGAAGIPRCSRANA